MNVGKLKRVAIKEFKRSPAKSGFLLVMFPVALYFCGPLLLGPWKKSSPSTDAATTGRDLQDADFMLAAPTKPIATPSRAGQSWLEVARSLENDLLAVPTGIPVNARNPFAARYQEKRDGSLAAIEDVERVVRPETETQLAESADRPVDAINPIRALGLHLNATVVGQRSRLATINGRTYREGETIPVIIDTGSTAGAVTTTPLELAHVARRFVVLEMDGYQHRLQLRSEVSKDAIVVKSRPGDG